MISSLDSVWKLHSEPNILALGQIDLWLTKIGLSGEQINQYANLLSRDELERANSFHFEHHREAFCIGRGILRSILSRYLLVEPKYIHLEYSAYGKPAVSGEAAGVLDFNLAHSGEWVLYAISLPRRIGVDIEQVQAKEGWVQIAQSFFAPREIQTLLALPGERQLSAFYACWTRKEAFIKALGKGLSYPLDKFCVSVAREDAPRLLAVQDESEAIDDWNLFDIPIDGKYQATLAAEGIVREINYWTYPKI